MSRGLRALYFILAYSLVALVRSEDASGSKAFRRDSKLQQTTLLGPPSQPAAPLKTLLKTNIPVVHVYLHKCPDFLRISLWQAIQRNDVVILVGHESCEWFCSKFGIGFFPASQYVASALEFDSKYFPKDAACWKTQPNPRRFEVQCFLRWFILKEFMRTHGIPRVFYADSDTMLYANVTDINHSFYAKDRIAYVTQAPAFYTISFAFMDLEAVEDLCEFMKKLFSQPKPLCTNDMVAARYYATLSVPESDLECWYQKLKKGSKECLRHHRYSLTRARAHCPKCKPAMPVTDIGRVTDDVVFDNFMDRDPFKQYVRIENSSVYAQHPDRWLKTVTWINDVPHFRMHDYEYPIMAAGLHFQGRKKPLIQFYMRNYRRPCPPPHPHCTCTSRDCRNCISPCLQRRIDRLSKYLSAREAATRRKEGRRVTHAVLPASDPV